MFLPRSRSTSLTLKPITVHHVMQTAGEDSSQSSLNLSASSGYLSGSSSANSSVGGSNLNLSGMIIHQKYKKKKNQTFRFHFHVFLLKQIINEFVLFFFLFI